MSKNRGVILMEIDVKTKEEFLALVSNISAQSKLYIFAAGTYGIIIGEFFIQMNIKWEGYIDNNSLLWGKNLKGKKIYSLNEIEKENVNILISLSKEAYIDTYYKIIEQIEHSGIKKENILYFVNNYYDLLDELNWYVKKPNKYLERMIKLKNIYSGNRCFIIGNGPSLKIDDLEKISNEITMGCNGIIELYEKVNWRPTCFFFGDAIFIKKNVRTIRDIDTIMSNCKLAFTNIISELYDEYNGKYNNLYFFYGKRGLQFSEKIEEVIYQGYTTLYEMLQVAIYMGIKKIYLLGVDFSFRKEVYENGKVVINDTINNHMELMDQVEQGIYYVNNILQAFQIAKMYADEHGIKIYNATRGGKLEVFERVNFDSLFD